MSPRNVLYGALAAVCRPGPPRVTPRLVAVSGGFDPLHEGHVRYLQAATLLGEALVVFLNSDAWLVRKKGYRVFTWDQRRELLLALRSVTTVVPVDDGDGTVALALRLWRPHIFAKGGDRTDWSRMPAAERRAASVVGCQVVFGVGSKPASSSHLIRSAPHSMSVTATRRVRKSHPR